MGERGFEQLEFYQDSLKFVKAAYRLAEQMPDIERYNLADQIRRAATSVPLNIAEGYGRFHYLDRLRFMYIARGSLSETMSAFFVAQSLGYCTNDFVQRVQTLHERIEKNLNGYCRFIRTQQQGSAEYGTRYVAEDRAVYGWEEELTMAQSPLVADSQSPIASPQSPDRDEESNDE